MIIEKINDRTEIDCGRAVLWRGDCLDVLRTFQDDSLDSVITDPPYGLSAHSAAAVADCLRAWINGERYDARGKGFMEKAWDAWVPGPDVWREVIRVLKPGGHALVFAGTRSLDLMGIALRLAGFELRDSIGHAHASDGAPLLAWTFGAGFPKGHDVSMALDRLQGEEREVVGSGKYSGRGRRVDNAVYGKGTKSENEVETVPATEIAKRYAGFNTALKPAFEPILLCRKPLAEGTIAANVVKHGTGGLNIGACRVPTAAWDAAAMERVNSPGSGHLRGRDPIQDSRGAKGSDAAAQPLDTTQGRWPANLIIGHHPDCRQVGTARVKACGVGSRKGVTAADRAGQSGAAYGAESRPAGTEMVCYADADGMETVLAWECHPDCPTRCFPESSGSSYRTTHNHQGGQMGWRAGNGMGVDDSGSAARFFTQCPDDDAEDAAARRLLYCGKATRRDRDDGCEALPEKECPKMDGGDFVNPMMGSDSKRTLRRNTHATVKPVALMRHLVRLITPPNGTVLDPFMGSGSTGKAALLEGFRFVGIEQDAEYVAIARARIEHAAGIEKEKNQVESTDEKQMELF